MQLRVEKHGYNEQQTIKSRTATYLALRMALEMFADHFYTTIKMGGLDAYFSSHSVGTDVLWINPKFISHMELHISNPKLTGLILLVYVKIRNLSDEG